MANDTIDTYPWGNNRPFNAYSSYCIKKYGSRLQKLSIDAGFTCPNRDGTMSTGGCTYCSNDAFNPSYCRPEKSITQQINEGIDFHKFRYRRATKYIAYFQPYSNTYKELPQLKKIFEEALAHPFISGIAIGTRPDCIDEEKLDYFGFLAEKHFVSIEYGIESCYNKTLESINRGHTFETAVAAIKKTAERQLFTTTHLIFGLPGESIQDMLDEAQIISNLPVSSIKLHQLQIIKGTVMADEYIKNPSQFTLFKLEEYISFIINFLERLNPAIIVERLSGEVPPRFLQVSSWGLIRADRVLQLIEQRMKELSTWQGRLYKQ
ncbi:MAG TPA: TIGR01212 family radical SAM protein [Bacteroidales bacterium]|nr:TIGR01212 family radical SAM protein [Bacteroidales bacterium]HQI70569.1 TIGR01212 family radical SAM protein [Bacteroidales bacterium]